MTLNKLFLLLLVLLPFISSAQDLSYGLVVNDLALHPMQPLVKPGYLQTVVDPSFGTTIRRITNANVGSGVVPMYSTIQAWNADESLMILYDLNTSSHQLLDGTTYQYIRHLNDVNENDLEQLFWDFNDPDVFYFPSGSEFIKYTVSTQSQQVIVDLQQAINNCTTCNSCTGSINFGNDVQMMSWDSDVLSFRCNNDNVYAYRISTNTLTEINSGYIGYTAPMPGASGNRFYHRANVYDSNGNFDLALNSYGGEHSCLGKLPNGNDGYFAVTFSQGPQGGCAGNLVAHDLTTGQCFEVISQAQGYDYSQSGTHISALAHKNTEGGWVAASMIGYINGGQNGQALLDQELVIAKAEQGNIKVCRIGHHRSDEVEFDYWGEPHVVISPTGTRVLFGSDWSGSEDGQSVDSYVVELPSYSQNTVDVDVSLTTNEICLFPNPTQGLFQINGLIGSYNIQILNADGSVFQNINTNQNYYSINLNNLPAGLFLVSIKKQGSAVTVLEKIIKY